MGDNPGSDAKGERTRSRGGKRSGPASDRVGRAGRLINPRAQEKIVAVDERPVPVTGPAREEMIAYLEELDRMVADDEIVRTNWRRIALEHLDIYLQRIKQKDSEEVLTDLLGRLLLVAENRNWVEEVFAAVKENWAHQAAQVDPLHRPHYVLRSRFEAQNG